MVGKSFILEFRDGAEILDKMNNKSTYDIQDMIYIYKYVPRSYDELLYYDNYIDKYNYRITTLFNKKDIYNITDNISIKEYHSV